MTRTTQVCGNVGPPLAVGLVEVEVLMSLMAWINYGLIVSFFVAAGTLIIMIARPRHRSEAVAGSGTQYLVHQERTTYIALAVLCLFLVYLAWAANKHSSA